MSGNLEATFFRLTFALNRIAQINHFRSEVAYYRRFHDPLFLQEERGKPPKTFATRATPITSNAFVQSVASLVSGVLTTERPSGWPEARPR